MNEFTKGFLLGDIFGIIIGVSIMVAGILKHNK